MMKKTTTSKMLSMAAVAAALVLGSLTNALAQTTTAVSSCVVNSKGVMISEIEGNSVVSGRMTSGVGSVKGILHNWETSGGSVRFYSSSSGRLYLTYEAPFNSGTAKITKVCKTDSGRIRMSGNVDGDPFNIHVQFTGRRDTIYLSVNDGDSREFNR